MANDNDGSSGSTATITPIEVPTVAFSNTENRKIEGTDSEHGDKEQGFSGVPGCGENTELKTGGSLRRDSSGIRSSLPRRLSKHLGMGVCLPGSLSHRSFPRHSSRHVQGLSL